MAKKPRRAKKAAPADKPAPGDAPGAMTIITPDGKSFSPKPEVCPACGRPLPHGAQGGRVSEYTPELALEICERIAAGEALLEICEDEHMPDRTTVARWVIQDINGFYLMYAHARDVGVDAMAENLIRTAKDNTKDWVPDGEGGVYFDHNHVMRARLIVDTIKWYIAKLAPRKYGDRLQVEVGSGADIAGMTDDQLSTSIEDELIVAGVPRELVEQLKPYLEVIPLPTRETLARKE